LSLREERPVTQLLHDSAGGDTKAAEELLPQVYQQLRSMARARLRRIPPGQTLQATALVHEAYMRIVGTKDPGWSDHKQFFAAAACAMRDILVDQARRKSAVKRGGGRHRISGDQAEAVVDPPSAEILAIDEAIQKLERIDSRKQQIVNMRYFARMTTAETAAALGISVATVGREWRFIRAWLERELAEHDPG